MDSDNSPPPRHAPPHIRLNSGSDDLLNMQQNNAQQQQRPQTSRQNSARSLIPQNGASRPGTAPSSQLRTQADNTGLYSSQAPAESAELLLPPRKSKSRRFRDDDSPLRSPASPSVSGFNSRRTSWSSGSEGSRDSRFGPFASPFDDSRAPSRAGSEDDGVNTQTVSEKYNILPSAGLLLFPEDVEKDDWLHTPDPNEREKMNCSDLFSKRGLVNVGGLAFITIGVLILFIGYPILTFVQDVIDPVSDVCENDPMCIQKSVPLMKGIRFDPIDPDTPDSAKFRKGDDGKSQQLVFSDEFNDPGRTFYDGDDPYWQGVDIWYGATQDIEWYDPDALTTGNGVLQIRFDAFENHGLNYRSGMLQSWNKLCYKGGYLEASMSLPGRGDTSGFWPGFWTMGNLGRPGYLATSDGMWPYAYDDICDAGITPNQSDPDGINFLPGMRLPACTCTGGDHPSPGLSRTAPEIDALEAAVDFLDPPNLNGVGSVSQSFQLAPFDIYYRPNHEYQEIYDTAITEINSYAGGPLQQAVSGLTLLNNDWYDDKQYQIYGFEYQPGASGYVTWNVGDQKVWKVTGESIGPNGNIGQRVMPEEPLAIIVNFGMSDSFQAINFTGLAPLMPATMRVDYVRIYQDEDGELTCDPADYPTTNYIRSHPEPYANPNLTHWEDAGYKIPRNSFMHNCKEESSGANNKREALKRREKRGLSGGEKRKRSWKLWE